MSGEQEIGTPSGPFFVTHDAPFKYRVRGGAVVYRCMSGLRACVLCRRLNASWRSGWVARGVTPRRDIKESTP